MVTHSIFVTYKSIKTFVLALRVFNTRPILLFYLLGASLMVLPSIKEIAGVWTAFIFSYASASLLNYSIDYESDVINNNFNPLSLFPKKVLVFLAFVSAVAASISALFQGFYLFVSIGLHIISGILYSSPWFRASFNPLLKFSLMMVSYCVLPALAGLKWNIPDLKWSLLIIGIIFQYSSWLMYSDIKDIQGDLKVGKITIAAYLGIKKTALLSFAISFLSASIISYSVFVLNLNILIAVVSWFLVFFQAIAEAFPFLLKLKRLQKIMGWYLLCSLGIIIYLLYTAR